MMLSSVAVLVTVCCAFALIAYDCSDKNNTITAVSIHDVAPCPSPEEDYHSLKIQIQVIQRNDVKLQEVKTCLIEVTRIISHCGMHSHNSAVAGGLSNYIYPLGAEQCRGAHRFKSVRIYRKTVDKIVINGSSSISMTLEGTLNMDGSCTGVTYTEEDRTWNSVVVYANIKIELRSYLARVKLEDNEISLYGGVVCDYLSGYCIDSTYGETVWEYTPEHDCDKGLSLLYQGEAELVTHQQSPRVVVVEQKDKVFALSLLKMVSMCGVQVWQSEHPKVLVVERQLPHSLQPKLSITAENTDLTMYVNSKLLYIEQAYKRGVNSLYTDTVYRRCLVHREVIKNRLLMAPLTPNAVSSIIKQQLGYVGRVLGEVLYIMKCTPKVVHIRRTDSCYHELPITVNNESFFMTPLTHLIQKYAEQVECSAATPPLYYIDEKWVGLTPHPVIQHAPTILTIEEEIKLEFKPIQPLGSSGLYTQEEIAKVQKTLMFGRERAAVENIIVRKIAGRETDSQGYSTVHLFDAQEIKKLAVSTLTQVWGWFTDVGMVMSGFIGFYVILRILKYIIGVVLNGFALYKTVGCGIAVLASLWNTLAMLILHKHNKAAAKTDVEAQTNDEQDEQATTINQSQSTINQSTFSLYPNVSAPHWTDAIANNK